MRHDPVIPAARLAAVDGSIVLPPAHEQPDVLTSDWLVLQFDRLHDTGEVIGVSESRGGALADAFACDLNEGRIIAIARVDTVVLPGSTPGRPAVLGPRRDRDRAEPPSPEAAQRRADARAGVRLARAVHNFALGFAACATLIFIGALVRVL
ncbi:hypothetical protein BSL82_05855 [Tardibacter chloracetimidivorans]|uniref:Uncharacterized protein n=1 Tax=Tardibacter chloracetimidivorans TaxID=1921510 RepID=A0A1L3ZTD7_9SPHN|nr:hypothetical protein [Tardibacter chloracetimidivorans]API58894.1 hypothetical protein BSL82_05855 [Tardibacter chloracetimidivorans]